jgi:hypothetical protein
MSECPHCGMIDTEPVEPIAPLGTCPAPCSVPESIRRIGGDIRKAPDMSKPPYWRIAENPIGIFWLIAGIASHPIDRCDIEWLRQALSFVEGNITTPNDLSDHLFKASEARLWKVCVHSFVVCRACPFACWCTARAYQIQNVCQL